MVVNVARNQYVAYFVFKGELADASDRLHPCQLQACHRRRIGEAEDFANLPVGGMDEAECHCANSFPYVRRDRLHVDFRGFCRSCLRPIEHILKRLLGRILPQTLFDCVSGPPLSGAQPPGIAPRTALKRLVLTHKDRLLRFGAELVFTLCELQGIEIVIIHRGEQPSFEEELAMDVLEIITVFSARLYGAGSHQSKKLIDVLAEDETVQKARGQLSMI